MKRNGFTLVELIGVIVLISLMVLIIVPTVDRVIKKGQGEADTQQEENIKLAARNCVSDKKIDVSGLKQNWTYNVTLSKLQEEGCIDKNIKLPSTGEDYGDRCVKITNISKGTKPVYEYELIEDPEECNITTDLTNEGYNVKVIATINGKEIPTEEGEYIWVNKDVTLEANINKSITIGNPEYIWNKDGEETTTKTNKKTEKGEGETNYTAKIQVGDSQTQPSSPVKIKIDKQAPTISLSRVQLGNGVKLSLSDNLSGLVANQTIYYAFSTDKEPTQYKSITTTNANGEKTTTVVIPPEEVKQLTSGNYYMWIREGIKDIAGNITTKATKIGPFNIDNTPPTCSIKITGTPGENGWYKAKDITLTLAPSDEGGSGVLKYGMANSTNIPYDNVQTKYQGNTLGVVWYGKIIDRAGNENSCKTGSFKLDKTPPTCTVSGGSGSWTNGSRTITATCADTGGSNCATSTFSKLYNTEINTTKAGAIANGSGGSVKDIAGNITNCAANQTVKIDKTKPTCAGKTGGKTNWTGNEHVVVGAKCKDTGGSGCSKSEFTSTISGEGKTAKKTITISDNANNKNSCTYTFNKYIDTTPPTGRCNMRVNGWVHEGQCLYSDSNGIATIEHTSKFWYTYSGVGCGNATSPRPVDAWFPMTNGYNFGFQCGAGSKANYTCGRAKDKAGNWSSEFTCTYTW